MWYNNNTKLMVVVLLIVVESDCVDCGLPCIYESCKYYKVIQYYCDKCGEETDDLYYWDSYELCIKCILKQLERVEYDG